MGSPIDLTNLRSMTDGDPEIEKALFEEFIASFEIGIAALKAHCEEKSADAWRGDAHALKGISVNLGAARLGELCKKAQDDSSASTDAKKTLLANIEVEYQRVRECVMQLM